MKKQQTQINSYLLSPKNLKYSSDEKSVSGISERDVIIGSFIDCMNGLKKPFSIEMIRDYEDLLFHKTIHSCKFDRVILNTTENASPTLESYDIKYSKTETRKWDIQKEYPDYVILQDGLYCKTYSLSVIPGDLDPGWINSVYFMADAVKMHIKPIPKTKHKSVINNHKSSKLSEASSTDLINTDDIMAIRELVLKENDNERLFLIKINVSIIADSLENLIKREELFEQETGSRLLLHTSKHIQKSMLHGITGSPFLVIRSSLAAFVPFYTSELYEDGGFLLGVNMFTGHPFQWNPQNRMNKNMVLVAPSGSGKTTTAMLIIHAFESMYPESFIFGIDPEEEYRALGDNMGFSYIDYTPDVKIGLDIFKMIPDVFNACETLCQALNIPELDREFAQEAAAQMGKLSLHERSFFKFYEILEEICNDQDVIKYFRRLTKPPFRNFFEGDTPKSNKMIISLKNIGSAGGMVHRLITQIALSYALGRIIGMPKIIPKLVMLDEVWMLFKHESLSGYIENMSRRGRKYNMYMMLATQNMDDLIKNDSAKTVVVNSDTVIFLKQNKVTIGAVNENFNLSKSALADLMKFRIGQALVTYGDHAVPVNIMPDEHQLKLFRPKLK
jgi:hypothetical protein